MKKSVFAWCMVLFFNGLASYGFDIVNQGEASAVIIIPDKPDACVSKAAEELIYHVQKVSGVTLQTLPESQIANAKLPKIYLGPCAANQGIAPEQNKGRNSFCCCTRPDALHIIGRDQSGSTESREFGTLLGVYYLLDNYLGVRWLWPGDLGCHVPKQRTITIPNGRIDFTPPLQTSRYSQAYRATYGWHSAEACQKFLQDEYWWERRHGFCWDHTLHCAGHAMNDYFKITSDSIRRAHPEWFNLLPDGTRSSDLLHNGHGSPNYISMCISNPELHRHIIEQWKLRRQPGNVGWNVPATECDTPGKCLCPNCLSWDNPPIPVECIEKAKKEFFEKNHHWADNLDLSSRYCRFYLELERMAKKVDPEAKVLGFAYSNYAKPPRNIKLNQDIQIGYVGELCYPWTKKKIDKVKTEFAQWAATGCTMKYRPNFMLDGHCMPIFVARKLHDLIQFLYQHKMRGVYYDSNVGQYAVNGPTMYMAARTTLHPDYSADKILEEYYEAFAPASQEIKEYFEHWEAVSESPATLASFQKANFEMVGAANGDFNHFYILAPQIYTPEVIAKGFAILEKARKRAAGHPESLARIDYLWKGLRNSELTLETQRCYTNNDVTKLAAAVQELDEFRASIENENVANMNFLAGREDASWNRPFLEMQRRFAKNLLPGPWLFAFDEKKEGIQKKFFDPMFEGSGWSEIEVCQPWENTVPGKAWEAQHGKSYDGIGWYRTTFSIPESGNNRKIILHFGSVDEACKVWLNGRQVLERPYPCNGDQDSWRMPFQIDITQNIVLGKNTLSVRVEDNSGLGGITGLVALQIESAEEGVNLLENCDFEVPGQGWTTKSHGPHAAKFSYDTQFAFSGKKAARITGFSDVEQYDWQSFMQKVQVEKGHRYRLHGHYRTSSDMTGLIVIGCEGAIQKHIAFQNNTQDKWHEFLLDDLQALRDGEANILLRAGRKFHGDIWFDNVSLTDCSSSSSTASANLVPNGHFEQPGENWIRRGPDREISYDSKEKKEGKLSCRLKAVTHGQNGIYQKDIPVHAGRKYYFQCSVRLGPDFTGRLIIQINGVFQQHRVIQDDREKWIDVAFPNLCPEKDGTVNIYFHTLPEGRGTFWIDSVELTES